MKLPFGQIPPGTFDAAFPKSPTTGLPAMHQGVETQARRMMAPPPMINTTASDKVAALGAAGPAPMTAALPAPPSMMMAAPRQAPVNPLGGMDSRPLSERSSAGPMSYAPRGVGTNNPNSYAVGRNNKDFAMRTGQAPMMMQPGQGPRGQAPMMLGGFVPPQSSNGLPPPPMLPAPGRDDAFWNQMSSDTSAFLGEQQKLGMDMQLADQTAAAKIEERAQNTAQEIMGDMRKTARARETYMIPDPITGQMSPTHFGMNGMVLPSAGSAPAPARMTADDLAATQAMGGSVSMQLPGGEMVSFGAKSGAQPDPKFTADKDTGKLYYVVPNGKGGYKRQWVDEDGVVTAAPAKTAPAKTAETAAAPDPKARMNALRKRLNLPEL